MFSSNLSLIEGTHTLLCGTAPDEPWSRLALKGLTHLISSANCFDGAVRCDTPFRKHFLTLLTTPHLDDEGQWLELYEDLAIFMREKALRPPHLGLEAVEHEILHYFELCGEWTPSDGKQVSEWYWYTLPQMISRERAN